jgi:alpha-tubulin suppressor-like RCC1 family protein
LDDGSLTGWGFSEVGGLEFPPEVAASRDVRAVAVGDAHSLALVGDRVYGWGLDQEGQATPPPDARSGVRAIAAGGFHSLALTAWGEVVAWGADTNGATEVPESAVSNVVKVAAGFDHSLALLKDGRVVAWGDNSQVRGAAAAAAVHVGAGMSVQLCIRAHVRSSMSSPRPLQLIPAQHLMSS